MTSRRKAWAHDGRESRHKRGYGKEHERIRAELMRTIVLCEECTRQGRTTVGTVADHIRRLADGGTGDRSNYQLLCVDCDRDKQVRDRGGTPKRKVQIAADGWPVE